jgi:hypothetical protein
MNPDMEINLTQKYSLSIVRAISINLRTLQMHTRKHKSHILAKNAFTLLLLTV